MANDTEKDMSLQPSTKDVSGCSVYGNNALDDLSVQSGKISGDYATNFPDIASQHTSTQEDQYIFYNRNKEDLAVNSDLSFGQLDGSICSNNTVFLPVSDGYVEN